MEIKLTIILNARLFKSLKLEAIITKTNNNLFMFIEIINFLLSLTLALLIL